MLLEPKCYTRGCKHYDGVIWLGDEEETEVFVCPAFPRGIPGEISDGENKHLEPLPNQGNATVFEKDVG